MVYIKNSMTLIYIIILYFLDVWLDYIRFEKTQGDAILGNRICSRGIFQMDRSIVDNFIDKYNELEREIMLVL